MDDLAVIAGSKLEVYFFKMDFWASCGIKSKDFGEFSLRMNTIQQKSYITLDMG